MARSSEKSTMKFADINMRMKKIFKNGWLLSIITLSAGIFLVGCDDKDSDNRLPSLTDKSYSGNSLELTYQGEPMPGKSVSVKYGSDGSSAELTFSSSIDLSEIKGFDLNGVLVGPGILPGSPVTTIPVKLIEGANQYDFYGIGETSDMTFSYTGSLTTDKLLMNLTDCKLKNTSLSGLVLKPAPVEKDGLFDYSSLPFHLVWELDPEAGVEIPLNKILELVATAPIIPVYSGTAYTSIAEGFTSIIKTIALTESGNIPVMYLSTLGGAAHIATTSSNMLQFVPSGAGIKVFMNPLSVYGEFMLATSDNKDNSGFDFAEMLGKKKSAYDETIKAIAEGNDAVEGIQISPEITKGFIKAMLATLAPQIANGVPLTIEKNADGADIYFDTATSVVFLTTLMQNLMSEPAIASALQEFIANDNLPGIDPALLQQIIPALPGYLEKTSKLEIGLRLLNE